MTACGDKLKVLREMKKNCFSFLAIFLSTESNVLVLLYHAVYTSLWIFDFTFEKRSRAIVRLRLRDVYVVKQKQKETTVLLILCLRACHWTHV